MWRRLDDEPRSPLVWMLLGRAVALVLLIVVLRVAAELVVPLLICLLPVAVLIGIYRLLLGRLRSHK